MFESSYFTELVSAAFMSAEDIFLDIELKFMADIMVQDLGDW